MMYFVSVRTGNQNTTRETFLVDEKNKASIEKNLNHGESLVFWSYNPKNLEERTLRYRKIGVVNAVDIRAAETDESTDN